MIKGPKNASIVKVPLRDIYLFISILNGQHGDVCTISRNFYSQCFFTLNDLLMSYLLDMIHKKNNGLTFNLYSG